MTFFRVLIFNYSRFFLDPRTFIFSGYIRSYRLLKTKNYNRLTELRAWQKKQLKWFWTHFYNFFYNYTCLHVLILFKVQLMWNKHYLKIYCSGSFQINRQSNSFISNCYGPPNLFFVIGVCYNQAAASKYE